MNRKLLNELREQSGQEPLTEQDENFYNSFGCFPSTLKDVELFTEEDFKQQANTYVLTENLRRRRSID